ncbi:MAG: aldo/keto reductase [Bryobacterales bacterium]|nr:aldo/keto reductase [Bryobacterales bacterium]
MATPFGPRILGRTGLLTGPLGMSASYGMPAEAMEMAFEHGMNYFYWGSLRREAFAGGLRRLRPQRERVILVVQSYTRIAALMGWSLERALGRVGYDYADILLLGYWSGPVSGRVMDAALELQRRGRVKFLAVSSHDMGQVGEWASGAAFEVLHFRYNAVERSAEREIFPRISRSAPAGMVAYTATSWKQLLHEGHAAAGERVPEAGDCYRFVLSNPYVGVCMTGTKDVEETRHALRAMERGPMEEEELAWMRRTGERISGKRLPLPMSVR